MKLISFVLSVLFVILTILGIGYVLTNKGQANAGFAVIPMLFCFTAIAFYRKATK